MAIETITNKRLESIRRDRTACKIGGIWYNLPKGQTLPDSIKYNSSVDAQVEGKDLINITPTGSASPKSSYGGGPSKQPQENRKFPIGPTDYSRGINRQNALTNSVSYISIVMQQTGKHYTPSEVIEVAREFEAYTTGDIERHEAHKKMGIEASSTLETLMLDKHGEKKDSKEE